MSEYTIEVENCKNIKGITVKEDLISPVCEWAAEIDDYFYRLKDSFLSFDRSEIIKARKSYEDHISKVQKFVNLGAKIITK